MLTKRQGKSLLQLARSAIENALKHRSTSVPAKLRSQKTFSQQPGIFVTLLGKGGFRGSMGYPQGTYQLADAVIRAARDAAFNDPRFKAVKKSELQQLRIRIDVLSSFRQTSIRGIKPNSHGIYIEYGLFKGLQLPEDAKKYKWTAKETVENALRKAGLAAEMWKDKSLKIYRFTAQVLEEK